MRTFPFYFRNPFRWSCIAFCWTSRCTMVGRLLPPFYRMVPPLHSTTYIGLRLMWWESIFLVWTSLQVFRGSWISTIFKESQTDPRGERTAIPASIEISQICAEEWSEPKLRALVPTNSCRQSGSQLSSRQQVAGDTFPSHSFLAKSYQRTKINGTSND